MTDKKKPNSADGRDSYDSTSSGELIQFFNKNDWSTGGPNEYEYICRVKWLGDYTWIEVTEDEE